MKTHSPFMQSPFKFKSLAAAASVALMAFHCHDLQAQSTAIARVGELDFTAEQLRPYLSGLTTEQRDALEENPAALTQAVRTIILQQLLLKEALSAGWDKDAAVVARLENMRQAFLADSYLKEVAAVPANYPSDEEARAAYDARKDSFVIPRQLRVAEIYIAAPEGATSAEKSKARIETVQKKLKQPGADFAAIARTDSDERQSAAKGGEIGWLAESSLQPEIRARVASMPKDTVSEPIKLGDGWYFVKVMDIKESRISTFDEMKPRIVEALRGERLRMNSEAYLAKLQQQNPISLNELALSKVLEPAKN